MTFNIDGKIITVSGQTAECYRQRTGIELAESDIRGEISIFYDDCDKAIKTVSEKELSDVVERGIYKEMFEIGGEDAKSNWKNCESFGKSNMKEILKKYPSKFLKEIHGYPD